jgi:hypothetical protein
LVRAAPDTDAQITNSRARREEGRTVSTRVVAALAAFALAGCASKSSDIAAAYVSPLQYESFSCPQLAEEAQRVSARASAAAGAQDSQSTKDTVATTAAVIIFWPAAFLVGGDKQTAAELARLKGEMEAIEQVSIRKNCGIQFRRAQT